MEPVVEIVVGLYREAHQALREEITGLSRAELAWAPAAETNSIAVLIVHTLGSEAEVLRIVCDIENPRVREAEFVPNALTAEELRLRIDTADALLDELAPHITAERLAADVPRPNRRPQKGLYWLVRNHGHAREHLAHIQLTRQVYAQSQRATGARS
jgi:hypothetical protein